MRILCAAALFALCSAPSIAAEKPLSLDLDVQRTTSRNDAKVYADARSAQFVARFQPTQKLGFQLAAGPKAVYVAPHGAAANDVTGLIYSAETHYDFRAARASVAVGQDLANYSYLNNGGALSQNFTHFVRMDVLVHIL